MGFGTINDYERKELAAIYELNEYFQPFQETVRQKVGEASKLHWVQEMCDRIKLYAVILCNSKETGKRYLLGENQGIALEDEEDYTQRLFVKDQLHSKKEERSVKEIENTGTSFSNLYSSKIGIIWIAVYECKERKQAHRVIANTLLTVLEESIQNLKCVTDYNDALPNGNPKKFMEWYIKAIQNCYPTVPDIGIVNEVSLHNYEKRESCGTVYFVDGELSAEDRKKMVCFDGACTLKDGFGERDNVQGIRKLLEICRNSDNCMVVSMFNDMKGEIIGMLYNPGIWQGKEFISVRFAGARWEMYCGDGTQDEVILSYKNGAYYIAEYDKQVDMETKCKESGISYERFHSLINLLEKEAYHGALMIVAEDAKEEVDRLCLEFGRGIKLADVMAEGKTKKEICPGEDGQIDADKCRTVLGMANVDGAIFFDYDGNCHGFSVILDGEAKVRGEKKRGARYNSAVNYIENTDNKRRCAIIRSEDKERGIEIITNGVSKRTIFTAAAGSLE